MIRTGWKTELIRLSLALGSAAVLGWLLGWGAKPLAVVASVYAFWTLLRQRDLNLWLQAGAHDYPPSAGGMWGRTFGMIFRMQRDQRRVTRDLSDIIDHLQDSLASMSDGAVMLSPQGEIEWCNEAASTLLGLRLAQDNGAYIVNLLRDPEFQDYYEGEDYSEPLEIVSPHNRTIHLSITITFFGERSRLLFARDITHTIQLERMRKDFIANVSHELRTPLTVIAGYIETLSEQFTEPHIRKALSQMDEQGRRMGQLIKDLMELSRLDDMPRQFERKPVDMRPMLETIVEEARHTTEGERIFKIDCQDHIQLLGSYTDLYSAFSNLVVNAAKYTNEGDTITLEWTTDDNHGYFSVTDTGPGIEPHHIPRLTERFYRTDPSRSASTGGTGLGLAIVKHVLLRHQAELLVDSAVGKGSRFMCVFPATAIRRELEEDAA